MAVIGTLVAAMAVRTRARDLLGPVAGAAAVRPDRHRRGPRDLATALPSPATWPAARWLGTLGLYDLLFGLIAYALFDFLLED